MSSLACDATIHALAARQHGAVARRQLLAAGVSEGRIRHRVRSGRLRVLLRGVYAVGPVPGAFQRQMAAVLAGGPDVWVAGRSAAGMWALLSPSGEGPTVHVATTRDVRLSESGVRVHRVRSLGPGETTVKDGVPITSPGRTILDLAARLGRRDLEAAVGRAVRARMVTMDGLRSLLALHPGRPGNPLLRSLLASDVPPAFTRSEAERKFLELVRSAGLPAPRANARVLGLEVDFVWPPARLIVEVDGRAYHSGDPAFERDRERDGRLVAGGYRVLRVTWRSLTGEPRVVIARVAGALAR